MATTRLIIRENKINSEGECVIYVKYTHEQKYMLISTGEKIAPQHWDAKGQKVRKSYRGFNALNETLQVKAEEIKAMARIAKQNKIDPSVQYVKQQLEKTNISEVKQDFFDLYEKFIKECTVTRAKNTLKKYRSTYNHLKEFEQLYKYKITLETINLAFYEKFVGYLIEQKQMTNNTVGKYVQTLKTFLGYLTAKGVNQNTDFRKREFKTPSSPTDIIYLTREELEILFQFDLSENKRLERIRDAFVFECTTGLRYSDLTNLKPENIKDNHIEFTSVKTRDKLIVPLNQYALQILHRNEGKLPKTITNQKMNKYLKELGKLCGLNESVQLVKFNGSKRIQFTRSKYELITTHTARRTFVTQSLERGLRPEIIMRITGHKDIKTMMKYVKITDTVVKTELLRAWNDAITDAATIQ